MKEFSDVFKLNNNLSKKLIAHQIYKRPTKLVNASEAYTNQHGCFIRQEGALCHQAHTEGAPCKFETTAFLNVQLSSAFTSPVLAPISELCRDLHKHNNHQRFLLQQRSAGEIKDGGVGSLEQLSPCGHIAFVKFFLLVLHSSLSRKCYNDTVQCENCF